jgi:hypothetical protein
MVEFVYVMQIDFSCVLDHCLKLKWHYELQIRNLTKTRCVIRLQLECQIQWRFVKIRQLECVVSITQSIEIIMCWFVVSIQLISRKIDKSLALIWFNWLTGLHSNGIIFVMKDVYMVIEHNFTNNKNSCNTKDKDCDSDCQMFSTKSSRNLS